MRIILPRPLSLLANALKWLMPVSLFGRALLILVVPTVLVQIVATYVFFERHWENVTRHMSSALAGEIAFLVQEIDRVPEARQQLLIRRAQKVMDVDVAMHNGSLPTRHDAREYPELSQMLRARMDYPFTIHASQDEVIIKVQMDQHLVVFTTSIKRLESGTTTIFIVWMTGSAALLLLVASMFLRNQLRPIIQLAAAAERFGKGQDLQDFKPSGAREVRRAGRAFMVMRERIQRQVSTRIDMLSGISHDLRTPLTRMKLQLAMLGKTPETQGLMDDVAAMERMIQEYLDFARGVGAEEPQRLPLGVFLHKLLDGYRRQGQDIPLTLGQDGEVLLRPHAMTRCLTNLIDNALRYGTRCTLTAHVLRHAVEIMVDDEGPGIPEAAREAVFRPFTRLDPSRNPQTGGVGLGLTIARDVVQSHGGEIMLSNRTAADGEAGGADASGEAVQGLRVIVRLPR